MANITLLSLHVCRVHVWMSTLSHLSSCVGLPIGLVLYLDSSDISWVGCTGGQFGRPAAQSFWRLQDARVVVKGRWAVPRPSGYSPPEERRFRGHISSRSRPRATADQLGRGLARCLLWRGDDGDTNMVLLGQRRRGGDGIRVPAVAPHRRHAHHLAATSAEVGVEGDVDEWFGGRWGEVEPRGSDVRLFTIVPRSRPAIDQLHQEERRHENHTHHVQYDQHLHHLHLSTERLCNSFDRRSVVNVALLLPGLEPNLTSDDSEWIG